MPFLMLLQLHAESTQLGRLELRTVQAYTSSLLAGGGYHAVTEDRLADAGWPALLVAMEAMAQVDAELPMESRVALESLLERMSRGARYPWPMIELYSPELAAFLTEPPGDATLSGRFFAALCRSAVTRTAWDLAVRLAPAPSLASLATGQGEHQIELLAAWNRRLRGVRESRPLPGLEQHLATIGARFDLALPADEREAILLFLGRWPQLEKLYHDKLSACLQSDDAEHVRFALRVQQEHPALLGLNRAILARFPDHDELLEAAILSYMYDYEGDHSATLREIWQSLPKEYIRLRHSCLQAMMAHPDGNDGVALEAVRESPLEFADTAVSILAKGDKAVAAQAVDAILEQNNAGLEPAMRLARTLASPRFIEQAVTLLQRTPDQIVRQTIMNYLQVADSGTKRLLLPWLSHENEDLRLSAIQIYHPHGQLADEDLQAIGPALTRIALTDPSMGHRQEALFVLGAWRHPETRPLFERLLEEIPSLTPEQRMEPTDDEYWHYRLRLMALLGLAALGDDEAETTLVQMHRDGNLTERMDVLLAFTELGRVPSIAFEDLHSTEPKLIATAVNLIALHGSPQQIHRMQHVFLDRPLWALFDRSGIDDHHIRFLAGVEEGHDHAHHHH